MTNLVNKYKTIFWESEAKLETIQKKFSYIGVVYKFVLKFAKSQNWIFWSMEYLFKALQCQVWWTSTKPFFWESKTKLETLHKLSVHIGVTYKVVLKCAINLRWLRFLFFLLLWLLNVKYSTRDNVTNIIFDHVEFLGRCTWHFAG